MKYSRALANRFKKDYNLPIPVPAEESLWNQYINGIFANVNGKDVPKLWRRFIEAVDSYDSEDAFFNAYTKSKEELMEYMKTMPGWSTFCNGLMDKYKTDLEFSSHSIYNKENVGKQYLSLDLKSANVQAYRKALKLHHLLTWDDFVDAAVSDGVMSGHFCESKYIRQVVFGQLNPKRLVTVEKKIISEIRQFVRDELQLEKKSLRFVKAMTDELIYEIREELDTEGLERKLHETGYDVRVTDMSFREVTLSGKSTPECSAFLVNNSKYKCVPEYFAPIFYSFLKYRRTYGDTSVSVSEDCISRIIEFNGFPAKLTGPLQIELK